MPGRLLVAGFLERVNALLLVFLLFSKGRVGPGGGGPVHRWGTKEVPSGFFRLPQAEHVSAVIFNSSATISKFNRIGLVAGFGSKRVRLVREGIRPDPDPNASAPKGFRVEVRPDRYSETWIEGLDVFHIPSARHPLDPEMLPRAAHHRFRDDGQIESLVPEWHAIASVTLMFVDGREDDRQE